MQTEDKKIAQKVADATGNNWVDRFAPLWAKPYLRLARLDRPIGFWLLFWPCAFSVGIVAVARPAGAFDWQMLGLFFIGAIAMRGAGCTFNDIVDRDIDDQVARTRLRPIPSGQVTRFQASVFLVLQALIGLVVLLQFNNFTIWLGIGSLGLVAIYPFMKRVTYWPQLFLGLAFSWGALMGWSATFGTLHQPVYLLYAGCVLWTIGYDTIYALQDVEDDALIGVKSTAQLFGDHAKPVVALFYLGAFGLWVWAGLSASAANLFLYAMILPGLILIWQLVTLDTKDPKNCLRRFWSNNWVGLALTLAFWIEWNF